MQCPRRTLLGGLATTATVALVGSAAGEPDESQSALETDDQWSLFEYVPATVVSNGSMIASIDHDAMAEADEPHETQPFVDQFGLNPESVSFELSVSAHDEDGYAEPIRILGGDLEFETDGETEHIGDYEYDRYEVDDDQYHGPDDEKPLIAGVDDLVFVVDDEETLETTLETGNGNVDRLLDDETITEPLETHSGADLYRITVPDDEFGLSPELDDKDIDLEVMLFTQTVIDRDTIEVKHVAGFADEDEITDEVVESIEADFAYMSTPDEPEVDIDGETVTVTARRDLAAERDAADHDSPRIGGHRDEIDPDGDELELEITRGDPTPVEDLTLEVNDEEYDRDIWADGQGTIEEGDTVVLGMDDVEPNTSVRLQHDHEMGSTGSGTTVLNSFQFEFEHDYDEEAITITYEDEFPLEGDNVYLGVYEGPLHQRRGDDGERAEPEPTTTDQPWDGETLSDGSETTLDGVSPGDTVIVGWKGATSQDGLDQYQIHPPGVVEFEYEYDTQTLVGTLEVEHEQPAVEYELLIEDEPSDTQWSDEYETVDDQATIELEVEPGRRITAVWGEHDHYVGGTQTTPTVDLEYDDGTVEHVGGDELPVSDLELHVMSEDDDERVSLEDELDGRFEEGDTVDLEIDDPRTVTLRSEEYNTIGTVFANSE